MLRAGRKDRKIVIERLTIIQDAIGTPTETWATYKTVWAEYIPVSGRESLAFDHLTSSEIARFIIHYISSITIQDRISFDGKSWHVRYLRELGRNRELEISAEVIQ